MNSKVMRNLSYGLFICSAREGDRDNACITNTVTQVASTPNRICVAINKANFTHDMIQHTGKFNISILSESVTFDTFQHFGFQSGRDTEKVAGITYSRSENGLVYFQEGANGFISANVVFQLDLGSHTLFVADVVDGDVFNTDPSVTYAYYFENIKPKPLPAERKKGWICTICGYIYEQEELPEDYVCPICKHPVSDFKPL